MQPVLANDTLYHHFGTLSFWIRVWTMANAVFTLEILRIRISFIYRVFDWKKSARGCKTWVSTVTTKISFSVKLDQFVFMMTTITACLMFQINSLEMQSTGSGYHYQTDTRNVRSRWKTCHASIDRLKVVDNSTDSFDGDMDVPDEYNLRGTCSLYRWYHLALHLRYPPSAYRAGSLREELPLPLLLLHTFLSLHSTRNSYFWRYNRKLRECIRSTRTLRRINVATDVM